MALQATLETVHGDLRALYIRINHAQVSNHGQPASALARGFVSRAAFEAGKSFVWEQGLTFDADVSQPLWAQAYAALRADPALADAVNC